MKSEEQVQRATDNGQRKRFALCVARCAILMTMTIFISGNIAASDENARMPKRIVSLSPVATEELFLLDRGDLLVGRTRFCTKPPEALKVEEVGNILEVSVEKIVALRPDLVLAGSMTNPNAKEKLRQLGFRVEEFPVSDDFEGVCESFIRLGRMIQKEKEAEGMVKSARDKVAALRAQIPDGPNTYQLPQSGNWGRPDYHRSKENNSRDGKKPSVFLQVGSDPLVTMTRGSFLNDLIEFAGGINIARDAGSRIYSREKVVAEDPDVIIISGMGSDGGNGNEREKKIWQGYHDLRAAQRGTIYVVDSDLFCAPTPLTFVKALKHMIGLLHPHDAA